MFGGGDRVRRLEGLPQARLPASTSPAMSYFVTGATGFIGRFLVQELVDHREGDDLRPGPRGLAPPDGAADRSAGAPPASSRSSATSAEPSLGVDPEWVAEHAGKIDHFFHLAAIYDMTADDATNDALNVDGTRHALELAERARRPAASTRSRRSPPPATTAAPSTRRCSTRASTCPRRTTARSTSPRRSSARSATVPWRVYRPGDRGRRLRDRRDGQGRRPLLLLPACSSGCATRCRPGCRWSASTSATPTWCRSTTSPRRWTTWPTCPTATARRSTWSTPSRSPWST